MSQVTFASLPVELKCKIVHIVFVDVKIYPPRFHTGETLVACKDLDVLRVSKEFCLLGSMYRICTAAWVINTEVAFKKNPKKDRFQYRYDEYYDDIAFRWPLAELANITSVRSPKVLCCFSEHPVLAYLTSETAHMPTA